MTRLPVLWLVGAPAAGKSAVAWELYQRHADAQVAYVDMDQLKMLFGGDADADDLARDGLAAMARVHRNHGTLALIVSGVMDAPRRAEILEALDGVADLRLCLLDADDDTLRERVAGRGWSDDLVAMVLAEAGALRRAGLEHAIQTSALSVSQVADAVEPLLALRPADESTLADEEPALADARDLVVIHGPRAVGKSTVSWSLFMQLSDQTPTGYLDADQLGFVHAEPARRAAIMLAAVAAVAGVFRAAGARWTIVNGNLWARATMRLTGAGAVVFRLDAREHVLMRRLDARLGANPARLAGDDLEDADDAYRAHLLAQAVAAADAFHSPLEGEFLDVSDDDPARAVAAIRARIAGEPKV